jgi:hypothetical protein
MRRHLTSAFLAMATGAAVAGAGLAGAVPAVASSPAAARPAIKTVIDTVFAGYVTTGPWRFRYVAATVPISKCRKTANQNASAHIALRSNVINEVAHIDLFCGGGHGSVRFGTVTHAEGHFDLSPRVGDDLKISIFRDQAACQDTFSATNTSTHRTKTKTFHTPCRVVYRHAELGGVLTDIAGTWKPPTDNVRLWQLTNTAITSYNRTRGTICGPWPAEKHLAAPVITIRLIPSGLSNKCRNFSVLLKGSS